MVCGEVRAELRRKWSAQEEEQNIYPFLVMIKARREGEEAREKKIHPFDIVVLDSY